MSLKSQRRTSLRALRLTPPSTALLSVSALILLASHAWVGPAYADTEWRQSIKADNLDSIVHIIGKGRTDNNLAEDLNGTGFILRSDGYVLTCGHVVPSGLKIEELTASVARHPEVSYPVSVVDRDDHADLVLLKLPGDRSWQRVEGIVRLNASSMNDIEIVAEGFALGLVGLSARAGVLNVPTPEGYWLTDASLEHGMSGGPVFNKSGEVVAVVKGTYDESKASDLVIPIGEATKLLESIDRHITQRQGTSSDVPVRRRLVVMFRYEVDGVGDHRFPVDDLRTRLSDLRESLATLADRPATIPAFKPVENDFSFPDATELEQIWNNDKNILEILGGTLYAKSNPTRIGSTVYLGTLRGSLNSPTVRVLSAENAEDYDRPNTLCAFTLYALAMEARSAGVPSTDILFYLAQARGALNDVMLKSQSPGSSAEKMLAKAIDAEFQKCKRP